MKEKNEDQKRYKIIVPSSLEIAKTFMEDQLYFNSIITNIYYKESDSCYKKISQENWRDFYLDMTRKKVVIKYPRNTYDLYPVLDSLIVMNSSQRYAPLLELLYESLMCFVITLLKITNLNKRKEFNEFDFLETIRETRTEMIKDGQIDEIINIIIDTIFLSPIVSFYS